MPVQPFLNLLHDVQSIACRHGVPENNGVRCPACREEQMSSLRVVPQSHPADEDRLTRDLDACICVISEPPRSSAGYAEIPSAYLDNTPHWLGEEGERENGVWLMEVKS